MATCAPFQKALAANSAVTTFITPNATKTRPSGAGYFDLLSADELSASGNVPSWLQLVPYGTAAADKTFDMRLYGWSQLPGSVADPRPIYIPQLLLDITVTLSALTLTPVSANTFLPDTFVINDGAVDLDGAFEHSPWVSVISPVEDLPGSVMVHTRGVRYILFDFDADAGGAASTDANCLWRPLEI